MKNYIVIILMTFVGLNEVISQGEVALLRVNAEPKHGLDAARDKSILRFPFELQRNLIWVQATVDEAQGYYILDTGAPTLLINDHGTTKAKGSVGLGSGGEIALAEHEVNSFRLAGIEQGRQTAYRIDLRKMEGRTGRALHGMVGHEQLRDYELLIDYPGREIQLYPARKNELHAEGTPRFGVRFYYQDHLPVITLKQGKKKRRFALDTGAGSNLIHTKSQAFRRGATVRVEEAYVNIQGLDGQSLTEEVVRLPDLKLEDRIISATEFVGTDLSHLQSAGTLPLDGILGTSFLRDYRVSIDFRKQMVYFW